MATQYGWRLLACLLSLLSMVLARYAELEPWRGAGRPMTLAQEAEDEKHDAEMLEAVKLSMQEWELKRARTRTKRSQGSVCYGDFGCFEDAGPFAYLETLPSSPQEVGTHFLLYSTVSRGDQPLLAVSASNMSAAWGWAARAFDSQKPTRVIVHGFGSNCDNVWVYEMRSALMAVEECNVICVDWEGGATMPNYLRAAANTRLVGKQLAMLLDGLAEHIDLRFEDVHVIGFSLGAHVAGFAGSELRNISRITGLDPAGPLFEFQDPRARLDKSDAKFVDVIHSNGETLIFGGLGAAQPLGHVDFYPNGGRVQHGCSNLFVGAVSDLVLPWAAPSPEGRSLCNHRRAYKFFTDSVSPKCHFPAFPCGDYDTFLEGRCFPCGKGRKCGNMGYYADRSLGRGQLYLLTREEDPFCAHQYHVSVWGGSQAGEKANYGRVTLTLHGDSGLNESFAMTKRDDAVPSGARFTHMIVPHPALGVPLRATLHYATYSGWLSAGAKSIHIDKLLIADSFGKTSSFCKKGIQLQSEEAVEMPLYPGDCQVNEEDNASNATVVKAEFKLNATKGPPIDTVDNDIPEEPQRPFILLDTSEWTNEGETGRAFGVTNTKTAPSGLIEIAEPVLRPRAKKMPRQRADNNNEEISEPLLRPTLAPKPTTLNYNISRRGKNYEPSTTPAYEAISWGERANEKEETSFVVQFLPSRLASLISRAERYARDTLLPLVSAYAPRLPIFGAREAARPTTVYIPTESLNLTEPVPTPTLEAKIELLRTVGPPEKRLEESPKEPDMYDKTFTTTTTSKNTPLSSTENFYPAPNDDSLKIVEDFIPALNDKTVDHFNPASNDKIVEHFDRAPNDAMKIVTSPSLTTSTALPPISLRSKGERIVIVYPSNPRDERKIRSHSYPEELQFEALYRHTSSQAPAVRVDLPTFTPPTQSTSSSTTIKPLVDSKFIPVPYLSLKSDAVPTAVRAR